MNNDENQKGNKKKPTTMDWTMVVIEIVLALAALISAIRWW